MTRARASTPQRIEELAQRLGLDYYPVDFELAPASFMTEIAVYGLPVRMPHWSFGVRYIHQLMRQSMGHSKIFEVMFPGDPCRAYLMDTNSLAENTLVTAHVLGHADFAKNNQLFARFHDMAGGNIVEQAAAHAHRIQQRDRRSTGIERVEAVLDAALALESHVDVDRRAAPRALPGIRRREAEGRARARLPEALQQPARRSRAAATPPIGPLRARDAAASRIRPAVVHRALRARARAVGARHLPRGARRVALLLPGVRLPDHERGLGVVLARAPAARSRFPAAAAVPRRRSRRIPTWCGRSPAGEQPRSRSIPTTSASRCGSASSRSTASSGRARCGATRTTSASSATSSTRELAEKLGPVRLRGAAGRRDQASPTATCTRCARRSSRPSSTTARRASRRRSSAATAAWARRTTTRATAAAWTWRAPARCWSTCAGSGAGPSACIR